MVVESHWKEQSDYKECHKDALITRPNDHQPNHADHQDHKFARDYIRHYRAHEESFFALEERAAIWAMVSDLKWFTDNRGQATRRTTQTQRTEQDFQNRSFWFHGGV